MHGNIPAYDSPTVPYTIFLLSSPLGGGGGAYFFFFSFGLEAYQQGGGVRGGWDPLNFPAL